MTAKELRSIISKNCPNLKFSIRTVSFEDLARSSALVVTVKNWTKEDYAKAKGALKGIKGVILE